MNATNTRNGYVDRNGSAGPRNPRTMTPAFVRWSAMFGKELLELIRSFKLIWVPLVFILLGVMQPVSSYYMPFILDKAGNLPEGAVIDIPLPDGAEVLAQTLSQYGTMGLLIVVLVFMGTVSSERNSGAASLILVKPVPAAAYLASKWAAMLLLACGSLFAGFLSSWYYTELLIGSVEVSHALSGMFVYALWLCVVMSFTLMFSTLLRSPAGAAFSALAAAAALSLLASLFPKQAGWSPGAISGYASRLILDADIPAEAFGSAIAGGLLACVISFLVSVASLKSSPAVD